MEWINASFSITFYLASSKCSCKITILASSVYIWSSFTWVYFFSCLSNSSFLWIFLIALAIPSYASSSFSLKILFWYSFFFMIFESSNFWERIDCISCLIFVISTSYCSVDLKVDSFRYFSYSFLSSMFFLYFSLISNSSKLISLSYLFWL